MNFSRKRWKKSLFTQTGLQLHTNVWWHPSLVWWVNGCIESIYRPYTKSSLQELWHLPNGYIIRSSSSLYWEWWLPNSSASGDSFSTHLLHFIYSVSSQDSENCIQQGVPRISGEDWKRPPHGPYSRTIPQGSNVNTMRGACKQSQLLSWRWQWLLYSEILCSTTATDYRGSL